MGVFDIDMSGVMDQLKRLERIELAEKDMVNAGLEELKTAIQRGYNSHVETGQLRDSIKVKKARSVSDGVYGYVCPDGYDSNLRVRNGEKAAYLEYGTYKQPSTPVVRPEVVKSEDVVIKAMMERYNEYISKF